MKKSPIILLFALFLLGISEAFACACVADSPWASIKQVDAVFVGKITNTLKDRRKWLIRVDKVLKGEVPKRVTFYASMVGTTCEGSDFQIGKTYIFFANKISADEVGQSPDGTIPEEEKEKIGDFEPETCSWTDTLIFWKSKEGAKLLDDYDDKEFLNILKKIKSRY